VRDDFPTAFNDALEDPTGVCVIWLLEADFGPTTGYLRLWTGIGVLAVDGFDWFGGAQLVEIEDGPESVEGSVGNFVFSLPWRDPVTMRDYIEDAKNATSGGLAYWREAHMAPDGSLTSDPVPMWRGRISSIRIAEQSVSSTGGRGIVVSVTCGDDAAPADRAEVYRVTDSTQRKIDPTDKGLEYLSTLGNIEIKWGGLWYSREQD
jgi:hypothetical protein